MITTARQNLILEKLIEEYINSAKPVSSQKLEKKYDFEVRPATIRNEMQRLTEEGFLYQPHTSAGRIPTDKGFRFFVDKFFEEKPKMKKSLKIVDWPKKEIVDSVKFLQNITKALASASSGLAISYLLDEEVLWKEGWEELLQEPEFKTSDCISNFSQLIMSFEKAIKKLEFNSDIKVYIGEENPFSKARDFSIIISKCHFPEKEEGFVSILGPKRMAYDRNIILINSLKELLEEF